MSEAVAVARPYAVGRAGHDSLVVVIPAEVCRRLNVKPGTKLLVSIDSENIIFSPLNTTEGSRDH